MEELLAKVFSQNSLEYWNYLLDYDKIKKCVNEK